MRNTGKSKITGLILKTILIVFTILILHQSYAKQITPKAITTTFPDAQPEILNQIERFYEISERSLEIGYNATLDIPSAFKTTINAKNRYIVASNFTNNQINLIFLGIGKTIFNQPLKTGEYVIFKIGDINLQFILHSANTTNAQVELKSYRQEIPENVSYLELFDIQVRLAEYTIYNPTDLSAIIEFTNFGEGPSHVRLIYSIIDQNGKEYHTGIDEIIVETNEIITKNFNTLKIPNGKYTIKTTIHYGKNQEATSEETFILTQVPNSQILKQPLIFIAIIIMGFTLVLYLKKRKTQQLNLEQ